MGHNIYYYTYSENCDKRAVEAELDKMVKARTYDEGGSGLPNPIRWLSSEVHDSYNQAREAIGRLDKGWYDQLAVRFKDLPRDVTSAKLENLKKRVSETYQAISALENEVAAKSFKAQFVSCKKCNSKLNKDYINSNLCPVCRADMRSETTRKRLEVLRKKHSDLLAAMEAEKQSLAAKKGKLMWLVKIEYHT